MQLNLSFPPSFPSNVAWHPPLIRKARTRCDLCRALHDFARLRLTSQCLPAGNYGWRVWTQRGWLPINLLIYERRPWNAHGQHSWTPWHHWLQHQDYHIQRRICHCSHSSVIRIIDEAVELKSRFARLPENLCFDEFRSVNSTMSFICCDAEGSHDIVAILENRLTKTIRENFMNRYTNRERAAVKSVVVDLNARYIKFIKALFPNARIIIDRFHIVQLFLTASSMISPTVRLKE